MDVTNFFIRPGLSFRNIPNHDVLQKWLSNRTANYLFPVFAFEKELWNRNTSKSCEFLIHNVAYCHRHPVESIVEFDTFKMTP